MRGLGSRRAANSRDRRVCSAPSARKSESSDRMTSAELSRCRGTIGLPNAMRAPSTAPSSAADE